MTREQELIAEYEEAMNAPLSERDKELMQSVLEWADIHPNWHKVDDELPPPISDVSPFSNDVFVTDGRSLCKGEYNYTSNSWSVDGKIDNDEITHWMYLPELPI